MAKGCILMSAALLVIAIGLADAGHYYRRPRPNCESQALPAILPRFTQLSNYRRCTEAASLFQNTIRGCDVVDAIKRINIAFSFIDVFNDKCPDTPLLNPECTRGCLGVIITPDRKSFRCDQVDEAKQCYEDNINNGCELEKLTRRIVIDMALPILCPKTTTTPKFDQCTCHENGNTYSPVTSDDCRSFTQRTAFLPKEVHNCPAGTQFDLQTCMCNYADVTQCPSNCPET